MCVKNVPIVERPAMVGEKQTESVVSPLQPTSAFHLGSYNQKVVILSVNVQAFSEYKAVMTTATVFVREGKHAEYLIIYVLVNGTL